MTNWNRIAPMYGSKSRYDFLAAILQDNPNLWLKVSPDGLNGNRHQIAYALNTRLGIGNVEIHQGGSDVHARLLTVVTAK